MLDKAFKSATVNTLKEIKTPLGTHTHSFSLSRQAERCEFKASQRPVLHSETLAKWRTGQGTGYLDDVSLIV